MIPIKSAERRMQDLEAMAAKLLETARKVPPGPERHDILKEIRKFRARIIALKAKGNNDDGPTRLTSWFKSRHGDPSSH